MVGEPETGEARSGRAGVPPQPCRVLLLPPPAVAAAAAAAICPVILVHSDGEVSQQHRAGASRGVQQTAAQHATVLPRGL